MRISLNGEDRDYSGPPSLSALLTCFEMDPARVAVMVNDHIVRREQQAQTVLRPNDRIEAFAFACGG